MYKYIISAFALAILAGCTKTDTGTTYKDVPVIEAYLQTGGVLSVKIKHQVAFSSSVTGQCRLDTLHVSADIDGTTVNLKQGDTGVYTDSTHLLKDGMSLALHFVYNGKEVLAQTTVPAKPTNFTQSATSISIEKISSGSFPTGGFTQPDPIKLTWDNSNGTYYVVLVENIESSPEIIFDTTGRGAPPSNVFRNQPTTSTTYSINSNQFQYFGKHRILLYHLNADYAALYNSNGTSSQNLSTLNSGITNAEGIFTGISADTI